MIEYSKEEKERFSFAKLPIGAEVLIHYKDGRKPEWFKYLGFSSTSDKDRQNGNELKGGNREVRKSNFNFTGIAWS